MESEATTAVFTNPAEGGANHLTLLEELIDNTPRRHSIHFCISHFDHHGIADALIRAAARGVSVRVIREETLTQSIMGYFLVNDPDTTIEITSAQGCFGTKIHTKLFLFQKTVLDGKELHYVSVISSSTLTNSSVEKHQDTVVVTDKVFYNGLLNHWQNMLIHANFSDSDVQIADHEVFSTSGRVKAYLFPRSSDPVANIIDNVHGTVSSNGDLPRIRIAIGRWTRARSRRRILSAIVTALLRGCVIDLVLRLDDNDGDDGVEGSIINDLANVRNFMLPTIGISGDRLIIHIGRISRREENVHNKYFLIEGVYAGGSEWETIVWAGSPGWTDRALNSNDEIMVKYKDKDLHELYVKNHQNLKGLCRAL